VRLGLYVLLIVAIIERCGWRRRILEIAASRSALAAAAMASVLPNTGSRLWHYSPDNPTFFTTDKRRTVLRRGGEGRRWRCCVMPRDFSMLWQGRDRHVGPYDGGEE
jgi:hypothetical protein